MRDDTSTSSVNESGVPTRALRIGVAGPVGTGKSSLIALLCRELGTELSLGVITNDIYTDEDARFLRSAGVLAPERIRAVETGACPHTAIRDDVSQNLLAVEDLSIATASDMTEIRARLRTYTNALIDDEWPKMAELESSRPAGEALVDQS